MTDNDRNPDEPDDEQALQTDTESVSPPLDALPPTGDSDEREDVVQLPRIFTLLALIGAIFALGGVFMVYNQLSSRLQSVEINSATSSSVLDTKVRALSDEVDAQLKSQFGGSGNTAKGLFVGSELSRTLFIMKALADDPALSEEARNQARVIHQETTVLMESLQTKGE